MLRYLHDNNYKGKTGRNLYQVSLHDGKKPDQYDYLRWDKPAPQETRDKVKNQIEAEKEKFTSQNGRVNVAEDAKVVKTKFTTKTKTMMKKQEQENFA